jgi:hypothetical protein
LSARYLLRFDDLCPTMDLEQWLRFERLIEQHRMRPILAVVPDNRDPELVRGEADPTFWERMRRLQASGATIGIHGFRHVCEGTGGGLIPLHKHTEFAGVAKDRQLEWIHTGLSMLRANGLDPRIWVAPRHGFDRVTLEILREEGIVLVSDGFAREPFLEHEVVWIPQQLWGPVEKRDGVWTICLHANTASDAAVEELGNFLGRFAGSFCSVDAVVENGISRRRGWRDHVFYRWMLVRIGVSRLRRRMLSRH